MNSLSSIPLGLLFRVVLHTGSPYNPTEWMMTGACEGFIMQVLWRMGSSPTDLLLAFACRSCLDLLVTSNPTRQLVLALTTLCGSFLFSLWDNPSLDREASYTVRSESTYRSTRQKCRKYREACGVPLTCRHFCESKCHKPSTHTMIPCKHSHQYDWTDDGQPICVVCRLEEQEAFARVIEAKRESMLADALREERRQGLVQMKHDLEEAAMLASEAAIPVVSLSPPPPPESVVSSSGSLSTLWSTPPVGLGIFEEPHSMPEEVTTDDGTASEGTATPQTVLRPFKRPLSTASEDWYVQVVTQNARNSAVDAIMAMTGLEEVKEQVLMLNAKAEMAKRQGRRLDTERFNIAFLGNPGSGKTTVGRHYAKLLALIGVVPSEMFIETTGTRLSSEGIHGAQKKIDKMLSEHGGGTIFIDEAYQLVSPGHYQGAQVLDFLLGEMEKQTGKIVFIFAGYTSEMEEFFEHDPGLRSRIPYSVEFSDFADNELMEMLKKMIYTRFPRGIRIDDEDGIEGLYGRIAIRRLGRGRGHKGFGNARALASLFDQICGRQAVRLEQARRRNEDPDYLLLVKEDIIGPEPSQVKAESQAWKELQSMIGLQTVKDRVEQMFTLVTTNYHRELREQQPHLLNLNAIFVGSPGTGKTTVGKLYGQILADLGLISSGKVVSKNPSDFIGSALGQSESQTKAILANSVGKVLIIDEAYSLYGGHLNPGADVYKTAVIDTIVAEVQGNPGEDRCVLMLGYESKMDDMFRNVNEGLARRFNADQPFRFEDYTDDELLQALEWKMKKQDLKATVAAKTVAIEILSRARDGGQFGNIGTLENLLGQAKSRLQSRQALLAAEDGSSHHDGPLKPQDFDPDYKRGGTRATVKIGKIFEDMVGCDDIIAQLKGWHKMARGMKDQGKDFRPHIPTNFIFKGPSGCGKTSTARKMGQIFYDMGMLSSAEVIECSASDLIGQYTGHTGPKTRKQVEKALGRVLFIDEAYRLDNEHYGKEAINELVTLLTSTRFKGKLIIILAGYEREMNSLLAANPGFSSRFPREFHFPNLTPTQNVEVLKRRLEEEKIKLDMLDDLSSKDGVKLLRQVEELSSMENWGNARDMESLAKDMAEALWSAPSRKAEAGSSTAPLKLDKKMAFKCVSKMLESRTARASGVWNPPPPSKPLRQPTLQADGAQAPPPAAQTTQRIKQMTKAPPPPPPPLTPPPPSEEEQDKVPIQPAILSRDPGVSDAVWRQLERDKMLAEQETQKRDAAIRQWEEAILEAQEREKATEALARELELAVSRAREKKVKEDFQRRLENVRRRELRERQEQARRAAALEKEQEREREEARIQREIEQMGQCVQGFAWIRQVSGYRCAGGAHFMSNEALGIH